MLRNKYDDAHNINSNIDRMMKLKIGSEFKQRCCIIINNTTHYELKPYPASLRLRVK